MGDLEARERGRFTTDRIEAKAQVEFEMEGVECHNLLVGLWVILGWILFPQRFIGLILKTPLSS
jgi:hypothetical protein